jgi:hypothetical protein
MSDGLERALTPVGKRATSLRNAVFAAAFHEAA